MIRLKVENYPVLGDITLYADELIIAGGWLPLYEPIYIFYPIYHRMPGLYAWHTPAAWFFEETPDT